MTKEEEKIKFSEALQRLEEIAEKIQKIDENQLEEIVALYEEGVRLKKICEKKISEAKTKITILKNEN